MFTTFRRSLLMLGLLCFALMTLGSFVRAADAGLACPDWPLCFDQPIPYFDTKIFLEWSHRVVAGLFSLGFAALWVYSLVKVELRKNIGLVLSAAAVLLVIQIMLGALTVWELLLPSVVASHLMNAVLILFTLIFAYSRISAVNITELKKGTRSAPSVFRAVAFLFTAGVFVQIWFGGMVSSNEAGLMCPDFPTCYGQWFPRVGPLVDLHLLHRYFAFIVLILALGMNVLARTAKHLTPIHLQFCRYAPVLVALQIALGVYNIYYALPVWASGTHLGLALLIFVGASTVICRMWSVDRAIAALSVNHEDTSEIQNNDVVEGIQIEGT